MTILITLHPHKERIWGIFVTGIFRNLNIMRVRIFDFQNGNSQWPYLHWAEIYDW